MAYYVRKISRAKWHLLRPDLDDNIYNYKADVIANDLRTYGNTLSLWKIDNLSPENIESVTVINSLLGDKISRLELIFIPEELLGKFNLVRSEGNTVVKNFRNIHYDISNLKVEDLLIFADQIMLKIMKDEEDALKNKKEGHIPLIQRYKDKQLIKNVKKWVENGEIVFDELKGAQQKQLQEID